MTWGAVAAAGITLVGGMMSGGGGGGGGASSGSQGTYDPYGPYRQAAAQKLNNLMANPNSITQLPEYQAYQQAAARTIAAQGYTGSGNALVAAAQAGGTAYQQAFNNLSTLAGAGQSPALASSAAAQQADYQQQQQNQMWGQIGNLAGNVVNNLNGGSSGSLPPVDTTGTYDPYASAAITTNDTAFTF